MIFLQLLIFNSSYLVLYIKYSLHYSQASNNLKILRKKVFRILMPLFRVILGEKWLDHWFRKIETISWNCFDFILQRNSLLTLSFFVHKVFLLVYIFKIAPFFWLIKLLWHGSLSLLCFKNQIRLNKSNFIFFVLCRIVIFCKIQWNISFPISTYLCLCCLKIHPIVC